MFKQGVAGAVLIALALWACGGADGPDGGGNGTQPPGPSRVEIGSGGLSVKNVTVQAGGQVTFVNSDSVPHQIASAPHPIHTDCPELNGPILAPLESFIAKMSGGRSTCSFHDHLAPTDSRFFGTITITGAVAGGPGTTY